MHARRHGGGPHPGAAGAQARARGGCAGRRRGRAAGCGAPHAGRPAVPLRGRLRRQRRWHHTVLVLAVAVRVVGTTMRACMHVYWMGCMHARSLAYPCVHDATVSAAVCCRREQKFHVHVCVPTMGSPPVRACRPEQHALKRSCNPLPRCAMGLSSWGQIGVILVHVQRAAC